MKKGLKIFLGIIGTIAAAALLFWLIFPGLPAYIAVSKTCTEFKDAKLGAYPYADAGTLPESAPISAHGLQLSVPEHVVRLNPDSSIELYTNKDTRTDGEALVTVIFIDNSDVPDMEFIGEDGFTQEAFDSGMRGIRLDKPTNNYEMWNMILNITPEDYNYHKHGTWRFYYQVMCMKEEIYPAYCGKGYHFENETAKGFAFDYGTPNENTDSYGLLVELYDSNDPDRRASALMKSPDFTLLQQIANSAQVVPEEGESQ